MTRDKTLPPRVYVRAGRYYHVSADGKRLDSGEWTIAGIPGGERPKVELRFAGHGVDASVVLPSGSPSGFRVDAGDPDRVARDVIDLDESGRGREPW